MEEEQSTKQEEQDTSYLSWHIFHDVPARHYTIHCDGYFDKNNQEIISETSISISLKLNDHHYGIMTAAL